MSKQKNFNFNSFYKIVFSISIVVSAVCLMWGCLHIYFSGNGYSREIIANTFSIIYIPIFVCIALLIISFFIRTEKIKSKFFKPKNFCQNTSPKLEPKKAIIIKISVILLAIGILIFGALNGGFADVLTKAVNICTECIGLG